MKQLLKSPELVEIVLNYNCNLKCRMCYIWKSKALANISIASLKKVIDQISLFKNKPKIQFLGGETLLYKDLVTAIKHASYNKIKTSVITNGFLLTKEKIIELSEAGLSEIILSLDSTDEKVHNYLRGNSKSYEKVMNALTLLKKHGPSINVSINSVITAVNLYNLIDLHKYVLKKDHISQNYFVVLEKPYNSNYKHNWRHSSPVSYLWPDDINLVNQVFNELIKLKQETNKIGNTKSQLKKYKSYYLNPDNFIKKSGCMFGHDHVLINNKGEVSLCGGSKEIGKINSENIIELWNSDKAKVRRKEMLNCKQNCVQILSCVYKDEDA